MEILENIFVKILEKIQILKYYFQQHFRNHSRNFTTILKKNLRKVKNEILNI